MLSFFVNIPNRSIFNMATTEKNNGLLNIFQNV